MKRLSPSLAMRARALHSRALWAGMLALPLLMAAHPAHAMTDQQEIALGKKLIPSLSSMLGAVLPKSDPMAQRVARVGAPFARLSKRHMPFSYLVVANDKIANAMAAPGGYIYITRKLVKMTANDAELAAILGHETAHVDRRHFAERYEAMERAHKVTAQFGRRYLGMKDTSVISILTDLTYIIFTTGYAREKESEADAWGVRWMSQLGYNPSGMVTALDRLPHKTVPSDFEKIASNHPPIVDRLIDVRHIITKENLMTIARQHGGPHFWLPAPTNSETPKI